MTRAQAVGIATRADVRADPGVVSVVLTLGDDVDSTARSIEAVRALDTSGFELEIVVAAPSAAQEIAAGVAPGAQIVDAGPTAGVVACRNAGARAARGEYLAFLAPGCEPERGWIAGALAALRRDARRDLVASRILVGDVVCFAGAGLSLVGEPRSVDAGRPEQDVLVDDADMLYPSDLAFVVGARSFAFVGGFDEDLSPSVAAADLGWRIRLTGIGVVGVADSRVQASALPTAAEPSADPDGLAMLLKNLGEESLSLFGLATLVTSRRPGGPEALAALDARIDTVLARRAAVQARRVVSDSDVLPLFRAIDDVPGVDREEVRALVSQSSISRLFARRRRVAIVTPDVLNPKMAGPAIRAWRMAMAVSREHDVRLASTVDCTLEHDEFEVTYVDDRGLRALEEWCDVLVFQGHVMADHPWLVESKKVLLIDIYDPMHLEVLEQARDRSDWDRRELSRVTLHVLNQQLARGDHFLCASAKQRDFWLGQLAAVGRVNPSTYDAGENLDQLISVVPFGLDDAPPRRTGPAIRGVVPGIGPDDKVILWGGGVYNWLDPLTLIHAVDKLRRRLPEARLYFMGLTHPNPNVPAMRMAHETRTLAERLDLVGTHVFFNDGWVAFEERQNFLLDADVGVSTHLDHVETAFSFRTRILDYLWASLPIVATAGDSFAELIEERGLGLVVPPGDVDALEAALHRLLTDVAFAQQCADAVAAAAAEFRWSRVLEPVLRLCAEARRAPDLVDPRQRAMIGDPIAQAMWGRRSIRHSARVAMSHLRRGEYSEILRKLQIRARALAADFGGSGRRG